MHEVSKFYGPNEGYVLELYERYRQDPAAVDPATRTFFETWSPSEVAEPTVQPTVSAPASGPSLDPQRIVGAARLTRLWREYGHLAAQIDPLGTPPPGDPELEPATHGITEADLRALPAGLVGGPLAEGASNAAEVVERLRQIYGSTIGYEDAHIQNPEERQWIRDAAESRRFFADFDDDRKRDLLERLTEVETFEHFLHTTFPGQKRFSIEGSDMLVPILDSIIRNAASSGKREVVLGMAHRGRLNVLAHVLGKPYAVILQEFEAANREEGASPSGKGTLGWTGDVKYHLGARKAYRERGIEHMPITLLPNPSHLEYVNPLVEGTARAAQERRDQRGLPQHDPQAALALVLHGDAAFPGEGVVAETLNLSRLPGYTVGGTIHIIVNNQIGFTTAPRDARSTWYASDLAKGFGIPIIHVNADDPHACIAVARLASAYIEQFHKDVLIDLVGYRRWGHNEGDEPLFTQPQMYRRIAEHPTVRQQWAQSLVAEGVVTDEEVQAMVVEVQSRLQAARQPPPTLVEAPPKVEAVLPEPPHTLMADQLAELNTQLLRWPEGFAINPKLERVMERRRTAFVEDSGIDWAHAETLAFASILADGTAIRLTGQDSERGTFSQRHLVLHDRETGQRFVPLQALPSAEASFAVYNSPLSENAVLGFEYGYSVHAPGVLVLWEAQFGDFANAAQVIIDQFIAPGRAKWQQRSGLVLLLPHGYEGQGPEHSSARLERFLQLAVDDNLRVVNCTTAAQYFHLLRRQAALLHRDARPLVVMTPKSLLRNPRAAASINDLANGSFHAVLADSRSQVKPEEITRLIMTSGKVAVELLASGDLDATPHVAVARLEELYPFPVGDLEEIVSSYTHLQEVVWLQEEPQNMGAWSYIAPRLRALLPPELEVHYVGRPPLASTAEGSLRAHTIEQSRILAAAVAHLREQQPVLSGVNHAD